VRELARKLQRRGFDEDAVTAALERLSEQRYLNDAEFARGLVARRAGMRGGAALAAELSAKGVPRETIEKVLQGRDPEADLAGAERYARGLLSRAGAGTLAGLMEVAGPRLQRRGFSTGVIREACRRAVG
jgi:regulatory protein